jgi:hypothetical protein
MVPPHFSDDYEVYQRTQKMVQKDPAAAVDPYKSHPSQGATGDTVCRSEAR